MIILLSPTKTFTNNKVLSNKKPYFTEQSNELISKIKDLELSELEKEFKISAKLAETTYNYYSNLNNDYEAIYQYGGTAFKYLDPLNLNNENIGNIYILSALYGILNAKSGISPYRLDITNTTFGNLYNYWSDDVNLFLKNKNKLIINLASNEYTKHLKVDELNIVNINFVEYKNDKPSSGSMMLKKMRGSLANYITNNNIKDIETIKEITIDNFIYNEELSNDKNIIFVKE